MKPVLTEDVSSHTRAATQLRFTWARRYNVVIRVTAWGSPMSMRERRAVCLYIYRLLSKPFRIRLANIHHFDAAPEIFVGQADYSNVLPHKVPELDSPAQKWGYDVKLRRLRLNWTQQQLAEKCGVNSGQISRIEKGRVVARPKTKKKIQEALTTASRNAFSNSTQT